MKTISLNGKWKSRPDLENSGIKSKWFIPKNYDRNDKRLKNIEIPKSFNLLDGYDIFEGFFGTFINIIFDWFNWGGIYRNVDLLILNKNRIKYVTIKIFLTSMKKSKIKIKYKILGVKNLMRKS